MVRFPLAAATDCFHLLYIEYTLLCGDILSFLNFYIRQKWMSDWQTIPWPATLKMNSEVLLPALLVNNHK